ncbi:MAG: hypothetical protein M4579_003782 [Chaenotheca gracillima]|nr:MAG: hypothetical protein M4579_003782 [Chaenotheca gracillima]
MWHHIEAQNLQSTTGHRPVTFDTAPKSNPSAVKQQMILTYLQHSGTVHNIKELEKALPSVASINGMQVKDFLQALWDDDKIRVEKIGSGNWYWSFSNEAKKAKERMRDGLQAEKEKIASTVTELRLKLEAAHAARDEDKEGAEDEGPDRPTLVQMQTDLHHEMKALRVELASYSENDPVEANRKQEATMVLCSAAERWTDNIYILEQYYLDLTGRDAAAMEQIRQMIYGDEYREGEGLVEL